MLRARELTVRRGATTVVQGLDWVVAPGRPAWVVGPNGAGKSTLLRVLARLHPPTAGAVSFSPPGERPLYFHAETALPPDATVGDWSRLAERMLRPAGGRRRTALWPDLPGGRRIGRLSTGERKRLLLDVLLRQPGRVLLLDEPYEHLSPGAKANLTRILERRAATGVVIVATNQLSGRSPGDPGLRLEAGTAMPLESAEP